MEISIDLSKLDDSQLSVMSMVCPDEVRAELKRRSAFPDLKTGFTELEKAVFDLRSVVDSVKQTAATRAVKDSGIITVAERLLITWENGHG